MTDDEIRDAWTKAGGDFLSGNGGRELAEAWINELRAFARAIAAAERERCIRAVDDAGGDNTQYHIDAISARSET